MKDGLGILKQVLRGILIAVLIGTVAIVVLFIGRPLHGDRHGAALTLNDINELTQSIEAFESEYGKLPDTASLDFELEGPQAAGFITVLLGKEAPQSNIQNRRQITFLALRISRNKRHGGLVFSSDNKPEGIYDRWGNPLRVILRSPGETTLTVPHAGKQVTTSKPFVVLSKGADGKWDTKDDVISKTK